MSHQGSLRQLHLWDTTKLAFNCWVACRATLLPTNDPAIALLAIGDDQSLTLKVNLPKNPVTALQLFIAVPAFQLISALVDHPTKLRTPV